jgi:hypothetical protein
MNTKLIYSLVDSAGGVVYEDGKPVVVALVGADNIENFVALLVREVLDSVESTPLTDAYTSHDLQLIMSTIQKAASQVKRKFQL